MAKADTIKSEAPPRFTKRCVDLTGRKFGMLTVSEWAGRDNRGTYLWRCNCECGNSSVVVVTSLKSGLTRSCGCLIVVALRGRTVTHGMSSSAEYRAWSHMIGRCEEERSKDYPRYGGRGIKVCERWRNSFENFFADMGPRPSEEHSIDRIESDGNYEPSNCRWATKSQQALNKNTFRRIVHAGMSMTVSQWAKHTGISIATIKWRLKQGLSPDRVLALPIHRRAVLTL